MEHNIEIILVYSFISTWVLCFIAIVYFLNKRRVSVSKMSQITSEFITPPPPILKHKPILRRFDIYNGGGYVDTIDGYIIRDDEFTLIFEDADYNELIAVVPSNCLILVKAD